MYNVLKKHSRKLLAVATAMLMIAFLLPTQSNRQSDYVFAHMGGEKVYASRLNQAQWEWRLLISRIFDRNTNQPVALSMLGEQVAQQMEEHPELYFLLKSEAFANGVYISEERLMEARAQVVVADANQDRGMKEAADEALRGLLMIRESFDRVASAVRVSQPLRNHEVATRLQQVRMDAVSFAAADYMEKVTAPAPEEVKQQFEKYKDVEAASAQPTKENPFAFGYRFPDRAQVQYLMVPEDAVRTAVKASQTPDRWRVDARKYYLQNKSQFTTTTQPAADPLALQKPKPVATTRPFEEVEADALEAVLQPQVTRRQQDIISRINSIIAADWAAYREAKAGEEPKTSLGVAYNSYEYLQKLSEAIEREFKVKPTIGATGGLASGRELSGLDQIGMSFTQTQLPFSFYATMTEAERKRLLPRVPNLPAALQPWQPSQVLRNYAGDAFLFRRTIIDPSHTPQSLEEVATRVEQDVKLAKAFDLSKQAAEGFAKEAEAKGFDAAALAARKSPSDTGYISLAGAPTAKIGFSEAGSAQFAESAVTQALQARARAGAGGQEKPVVVVPVQKDGKVVVGELEEVRSRLQGISMPLVAAQIDNQIELQFASLMLADWFNYENVVKRLQYVPVEAPRQQSEEDGEGAPPRTPLGI